SRVRTETTCRRAGPPRPPPGNGTPGLTITCRSTSVGRVPAVDKSGPTRPPRALTWWHAAQPPLPVKIASPAAALPPASAALPAEDGDALDRLRMYATSCQTS